MGFTVCLQASQVTRRATRAMNNKKKYYAYGALDIAECSRIHRIHLYIGEKYGQNSEVNICMQW